MWHFLPAELASIDKRLDNWGSWARPRGGVGTCMSAEGRFRRKAGEDDQRRQPVLMVDAIDASFVDAVIAPVAFPRRFSMLLKAHYVWRVADRNIRRELAIHVAEWEPTARSALFAARNALARYNRPC